MSNELFQIGDAVYYTGDRFKSRLNGKKGWIHWSVKGQPGVWSVEFPDTANRKEDINDTDDYIMPTRVLTKWRPTPAEEKKQAGPDIQPRRKRREQEEE